MGKYGHDNTQIEIDVQKILTKIPPVIKAFRTTISPKKVFKNILVSPEVIKQNLYTSFGKH